MSCPTRQTTERLPDCSILDALCTAHLKTPIGQYLERLQRHTEGDCAQRIAIAKAEQLLEVEEPECECRTDGGDLFDPRECPTHDSRSPWNVRLRAVTAVQVYEQEVA